MSLPGILATFWQFAANSLYDFAKHFCNLLAVCSQ
jgi:hypothetical protein